VGNPWIFEQTACFLQTGELLPQPSLSERIDAALFHLRTMASDPMLGRSVLLRRCADSSPITSRLPGVSALRCNIVNSNNDRRSGSPITIRSNIARTPTLNSTTQTSERSAVIKQAALAICFYALFQVCLPLVRVPGVRLPVAVLLLLVIIPTMAFMFLQVRLALCVIRLNASTLTAFVLAWVSLKLWWLTVLIHPHFTRVGMHSPVGIGFGLFRNVMQDLTITLGVHVCRDTTIRHH